MIGMLKEIFSQILLMSHKFISDERVIETLVFILNLGLLLIILIFVIKYLVLVHRNNKIEKMIYDLNEDNEFFKTLLEENLLYGNQGDKYSLFEIDVKFNTLTMKFKEMNDQNNGLDININLKTEFGYNLIGEMEFLYNNYKKANYENTK